MSSSDRGESSPWHIVRQYIRISGLGDRTTIPRVERFNPVGLFVAILTGTVLAFFDGVISLVSGIFGAINQILGELSWRLATLIELVFGIPRAFSLSIQSAQIQLTSTGIASAVIAILVVGLTAYILNWGVSLIE